MYLNLDQTGHFSLENQVYVKPLWKPGQTRKDQAFTVKSPADVVALQRHLLRMGYAVVERDDSRQCPHCTELTLVRTRCGAASSS